MTKHQLLDALWLTALVLLFVTLLALSAAANNVPETDSDDWYRPIQEVGLE